MQVTHGPASDWVGPLLCANRKKGSLKKNGSRRVTWVRLSSANPGHALIVPPGKSLLGDLETMIPGQRPLTRTQFTAEPPLTFRQAQNSQIPDLPTPATGWSGRHSIKFRFMKVARAGSFRPGRGQVRLVCEARKKPECNADLRGKSRAPHLIPDGCVDRSSFQARPMS